MFVVPTGSPPASNDFFHPESFEKYVSQTVSSLYSIASSGLLKAVSCADTRFSGFGDLFRCEKGRMSSQVLFNLLL
jgi:hypothetical protein